MTSGQFRQCLATLRWRQWQIAEDLGITQLKVRRWSCGLERIPQPVALWMRALTAEIDAAYSRHPPPAVQRYQRTTKPALP